MKFLLALAAVLLPALVSAQNQTIIVGQGGPTYSPTNITATPGSVITFEFVAGNHTVTQSSFATPCDRLVNASTGAVGVDSGFQPVASGATTFPIWQIQVTETTTPLWFYCAHIGHCQLGMVFAINANPDSAKSYSAYLDNALAAAPATTTDATGTLPSGTTTTPSGTTTGGAFKMGASGVAGFITAGALVAGLFML